MVENDSHVERDGLHFQDDMKFPIDWQSIPGVKEAGWKPDETINPKLRMLGSPGAPSEEELLEMMERIIARVKKHSEVWPFLEPVDPEEVGGVVFTLSSLKSTTRQKPRIALLSPGFGLLHDHQGPHRYTNHRKENALIQVLFALASHGRSKANDKECQEIQFPRHHILQSSQKNRGLHRTGAGGSVV